MNYSQTPIDTFTNYQARGIAIIQLPHDALFVRKEAA